MLLSAWAVWVLASFRLLPFSRSTIGIVLVLLALVTLRVLREQGSEIRDFVRLNARHSWPSRGSSSFSLPWASHSSRQPGLWHPVFGGEKRWRSPTSTLS